MKCEYRLNTYVGLVSGLLKNIVVVNLFVYNSFKLLQLLDIVAKLTANGESKWSKCNVRISFNLDPTIRHALVKVKKLVSLPDNVFTVTFNLYNSLLNANSYKYKD